MDYYEIKPKANHKLTVKILDFLQKVNDYKQLTIGVNETLKNIQKYKCEIVLLAQDCEPLENILMVPGACENNNIAYIYVDSKANLGRACGIQRPAVCCSLSLKTDSPINNEIYQLKDQIEQQTIKPL